MGDRLAVRIDVLGPTRLTVDGSSVEISRLQVRRVLTLLAARSVTPTSTDELVEYLWPGRLPSDPRSALSVVMSRARSALGPHRDLLTSDSDGHSLDAEVDLVDFESLLSEARATTAVADRIDRLEACLGLWRGRPFSDDADAELLAPIQTRLDEARWSAATLLLEASEEEGDHERVVAIGRPLHQEQPQREQLAAALARSLSALGRRADALGVLATTRLWLRDQLGLDASPQLTRLESDVLQSSVELAPGNPAVVSESGSAHFVDRKEAQRELLAGGAGTHVVVGEPGIGKSALLRHLTRRFAETGREVFHVTVGPSAERPLDTAAQLVEQLSVRRPISSESSQVRAALARVAPESVAVHDGNHAITRDVLIESVVEFVTAAAPPDQVVLIVDDVQWSDQVSLTILGRLGSEQRCHLVVGSRVAELEELSAESRTVTTTIDLEPLGSSDVRELVELALPSIADQSLSDSLAERSGGNPLFVTLLIDLLAEGDHADGGLPASVLLAIQERLQSLSSRAYATVQVAATVGSNISMAAMRQLVPTAEADIEEAVAAGLMDLDRWVDRVRFTHALVGEGAYHLLPEGRRVALHDQVGEVLRSLGAPPAEFARHFHEASTYDPRRAAEAHAMAAAEFARVYSWEEVESHAMQGLELLQGGGGLLEARLAVLLGTSQRAMHRVDASDALLRGAAAALDAGDVELVAEATIAMFLQDWSMTGEVSASVPGLLEQALALDLAPAYRARVCAAASTLSMSKHHARARALYHEAIEMVLTLDDADVQAEVLRYGRWGLSHPDDLGMLIEVTKLLSDVAGVDFDYRWGVATNRYAIGTITGDRSLAGFAVETLRAMHAELGPSPRDWEMAHIETSWATATGDLDRAENELDRAFRLAAETTSTAWMQPIYGACLVGVRRAQGRVGELLPFLDMALERLPAFSGWRSVAAGVAAVSGDLDRARRELDFVVGLGFDAVPPDATWTSVMTFLADAAIALDDRRVAQDLYQRLAPYSGRMSWSGVCSTGPIDHSLAGLAETLGDEPSAASHRETADHLVSAFHQPTSLLR